MPELLSSSSSESSARTTGRSTENEQDSFVITETGDKDHDPGALSHQIKVSDLVEKILQVRRVNGALLLKFIDREKLTLNRAVNVTN